MTTSSNPTDRPGALAPYRAIDLTGELGALCPLFLAGLGAEVIRVEPPSGDPARGTPPSLPGSGSGMRWLQLRAGLRSVTLDLTSEADRSRLRGLASTADVWVESQAVGALASIGLSYDDLHGAAPRLIYTSISAFGQDGPKAGWTGSDLVGVAAGGLMSLCGDRDRPPLRPSVEQGYAQAGLQALVGTLIALHAREVTGRGQWVDVSMQDAVANTLGNARLYAAMEGMITRRAGGGRAFGDVGTRMIYPSADGYVAFIRVPQTFPALARWFDETETPRRFDPEAWSGRALVGASMPGADEVAALEGELEPFFAARPTMELYEEGQRRGLMICPVSTMADLASNPQLLHRGFFTDVEEPTLGRTLVRPGAPFRLSATPWRMGAVAGVGEMNGEVGSGSVAAGDTTQVAGVPQDGEAGPSTPRRNRVAQDERNGGTAPVAGVGEMDGEVGGEVAARSEAVRPFDPSTRSRSLKIGRLRANGQESDDGQDLKAGRLWANGEAAAREIFAGVRIADFAWVGVGPNASQQFAWHGAEVIRVESALKPDTFRSSGPLARDVQGLDRSAYWANHNRDKLGMQLNLRAPGALEVARRLVAASDIVTESFTPGFMAEVGLDYESLRAVRPDVIMISMSMEGQGGPHASFRGYGLILQATAGITGLTGWPDRPPVGTGVAYTDWFATHCAAAAMLAALDHRRRTGEGQYIDLSQLESTCYGLDEALLRYLNTGEETGRQGNRHPRHAPHGVFPCAGDDQWCAIAVTSDAAWLGLCRAMGREDWRDDPSLRTAAGRLARQDELEAAVGAWTQDQRADEVQDRLQLLGAPAHAVLTAAEVETDAQILHRGHLWRTDHPVIGPLTYDGPAYRLSETRAGPLRPAPLLGQHNAYVYREVLGYSEEEFAELVAAGVVE